MKKMKYYHDLLLEYNVLLSAVFEIFRINRLKNYEMCPSHYMSAPALS